MWGWLLVADIFVSYKREDRARILPIVRALEARGYTVWWDLELIAGQKWSKRIKSELDAAKCVIVAWTHFSVAEDRTYVSEWVENEADEGARRGVLIPALLDRGCVAWTHQKVQRADLMDWDPSGAHEGFAKLLEGVERHAGTRESPEAVELAAWMRAERAETAEAFRAFVSAHPDSRFAALARDRATELEEAALRVGNASVEELPDIEVVDLRKISVIRPVANVTDNDVKEALARLFESKRNYEDKRGPAVAGDEVILDFVGVLDGQQFPGGDARDASVVIGSKRYLPEFEQQLLGAKAGDKKAIYVTFPADYHTEAFRNKIARFDVVVKRIRKAVGSSPSDGWARKMGYANLGAARKSLRQDIASQYAKQSRAKVKRKLFDRLDAAYDFPLPPTMVEAEFKQIWVTVDEDRKAGRLDEFDAAKSEAQLKSEYHRIAERRVRLGLLLAEIGRRNNVEVTEADTSAGIAAEAKRYPGRERELAEAYRADPKLLARIRAPIYEDKTVDVILRQIKITDVSVSREALFAPDD